MPKQPPACNRDFIAEDPCCSRPLQEVQEEVGGFTLPNATPGGARQPSKDPRHGTWGGISPGEAPSNGPICTCPRPIEAELGPLSDGDLCSVPVP
ncbi:hypothetical protein NDU88_003407 [Pleurodeles waltl]|uniref:Uncharacterized protein n=1 Tax=Pleurodeles waltl TaxID=8319 RepID=A0AAV7W590_PLEWA|nr:hypothetical protein NDU88_003407 [Pleurodeles waltl]